ncbi:MAG: transglycosylase domain-containing protein [Chitinophagaceae bacterium]|jgi:penicillin-binding protein 1A|nr:transglycosylase domain-containing protein [Chitinophagaceae bacterium]
MRSSVKTFWKFFAICWGVFLLFLVAVNLGLFGKLPSLVELENPSMLSSSEIYAIDGSLMGKYYLKDRINVKYQDISPNVVKALIATEDERFYEHSGIDARSLARAMIYLGSEGGASTITQQLAKNLLFGEGSKNIVMRVIEKFKEWIVAIKLERNFTKEEILALYLNMVTYGDEIYGIRNAAKTYFQKEPDRLAVEEAAVLVGLLKGSTKYNPRRNPKASMDRRNTVLDQMVRNDFLAAAEADKLKLKPIQLKYRKMDENAGIAPYFREVLRDEVKKWCKQNKNPKTGNPYDIYKDGLKIFTTINPKMQEYAEIAVFRHMQNLQKVFNNQKNIKDGSAWKTKEGKAVLQNAIKQSERWRSGKEDGLEDDELLKTFQVKVPMKVFAWNDKREKDTLMTPMDSIKYHKQILQIGMLSMDPLTGEIKAWVGGSNFKSFKFDHVNINTKRQVGSTFKPILYTVGVMNGYTPETVFPGGPINMGNKVISGSGGPMAICLAYSKNPGAVYLINQLGIQRTIEFAKECGIQSKIPAVPSIALGSADLSLYEMVQAYTMFPGRGFNVKPYYINRIEDRNGNVLASFHTESREVVSESDAYVMTKMMQGVVDFGTGRAVRSAYGLTAELAGKTGTTNDNADGWFIGFSPQLLTGVWVGCDDPFLRLLYTTGGAQMAMPAWAYYYQEVFRDKSLGVDPQSRFMIPEKIGNEAIYDYQTLTQGELPPPAEGEDVGSGSSSDFIDVPISDGSEKVVSESQKVVDEEKKVLEEARKGSNEKSPEKSKTPVKPSVDTPPEKKKGLFKKIFGKKDQS